MFPIGGGRRGRFSIMPLKISTSSVKVKLPSPVFTFSSIFSEISLILSFDAHSAAPDPHGKLKLPQASPSFKQSYSS